MFEKAIPNMMSQLIGVICWPLTNLCPCGAGSEWVALSITRTRIRMDRDATVGGSGEILRKYVVIEECIGSLYVKL